MAGAGGKAEAMSGRSWEPREPWRGAQVLTAVEIPGSCESSDMMGSTCNIFLRFYEANG